MPSDSELLTLRHRGYAVSDLGDGNRPAMSRIDRITIQTYQYTLDLPRGGRPKLTRFLVTIDTDDGLSGSYAPHFGGTPHAQAQVQEMARGLIGTDPEQRERISSGSS